MTKICEQMRDTCLGFRVRVLARAVTEIYDRALASHDLTTSQGNMLGAVACAGPVSSGALGLVTRMEKSTASRVLEGLKKRGLVRVAPSDDRRLRLYEATKAGLQLLETLQRDWEAAQEETRALLGPRGESMLHALADPLLEEGIRRARQKDTKR